MLLAACNTPEPTNAYVGIWEHAKFAVDNGLFYISSDTIKVIERNDDYSRVHHLCHYKIVRDSVVELERCWLEIWKQNVVDFYYDESRYKEEVYMYIDEEGYLIVKNFDYGAALTNPYYYDLKLKRYEGK